MPSRRSILAACGSALLAGCTTFAAGNENDDDVTGSWPQRGYDSAWTGSQTDTDLQRAGPEPPLSLVWSYEFNESEFAEQFGGNPLGFAVGRRRVYACHRDVETDADGPGVGTVAALDRTTGAVDWRRRNEGTSGIEPDSIALVDGWVVVRIGRRLWGVRTDGEAEWEFGPRSAFSPASHPVGVDGTVYAGGETGTGDESTPAVFAFDVADGSIMWRREFDAEWPSAELPPAVADGTVYVTGPGTGVLALDAEGGTERWRTELPATTGPTVADGRVYATTGEERGGLERAGVAALDAATGEVLWERDDAGDPSRRVAATDGRLYYSTGTRLTARDGATGARVWDDDGAGRPATEGVPSVTELQPAVVGDRIYAVGDAIDTDEGRRLCVFDRRDGTLVDEDRRAVNRPGQPIAVVGGRLYVSVANGLEVYEACRFDAFGRCL